MTHLTTPHRQRPFTLVLNNRDLGGKTVKRTNHFCVFCEARCHWAQDCKRVTSVTDRREKLKSAHLCFLCLNRGHNARACNKRDKASCTKYRGAHHRSICDDAGTTTRPTETSPTTVGRIDVAHSNYTYLQNAMVRVVGPTGLSKITLRFGQRQPDKLRQQVHYRCFKIG